MKLLVRDVGLPGRRRGRTTLVAFEMVDLAVVFERGVSIEDILFFFQLGRRILKTILRKCDSKR